MGKLEPGSKSQFHEWHGGWVPGSEGPGGEATGTCLAPATQGVRGSARPRLTWAWTPRSGSRRVLRPGSASQRRERALGQPSRPPRPPPSSGPPLPAGPRRPRGGEGGGGAEGPNGPTHLLDGGLAAAPQAHEQNPRLGAVSAPRATATSGPRPNPAARGCRLRRSGCQARSSLLGMAAGAVGDVVQGPHGGGPLPSPGTPPDLGP